MLMEFHLGNWSLSYDVLKISVKLAISIKTLFLKNFWKYHYAIAYMINKKKNLQRFKFLNNNLSKDSVIFEKNVFTPMDLIVEK